MKKILYVTAKLAKEKGFDAFCRYNYFHYTGSEPECMMGEKKIFGDNYKFKNSIDNRQNENPNAVSNDNCTAPTQASLQRWLYENHSIWVSVIPIFSVNELMGIEVSLRSWKFPLKEIEYDGYDLYEGLELGLQEALKEVHS